MDGFNALFCSTSGMHNTLVNLEKLNVYPNPAVNEIQFIYEKEQGPIELKMYSILGEEIKTINTSEKSINLSIQNLPQGLYLYKISQNHTLLNEGKFVKE